MYYIYKFSRREFRNIKDASVSRSLRVFRMYGIRGKLFKNTDSVLLIWKAADVVSLGVSRV